jgi:hypothetical protein
VDALHPNRGRARQLPPRQSIDLAVAAEALGADGAYSRSPLRPARDCRVSILKGGRTLSGPSRNHPHYKLLQHALLRGLKLTSNLYRPRGAVFLFGASDNAATVQQFADAYFREQAEFAFRVFF